MLQQLPNALTLSRLLLALPLGLLILREQFAWALALGFIAGVTDALDGFAARRLGAFSRLGSILDPVADKTLIMITFLSLAHTGLIPWPLALLVLARDLVIVCGAAIYHRLFGPFEFSATLLSKANMGIQIAFCVLVLAAQLLNLPEQLLVLAGALVIFIALASGIDYVLTWSRKALQQK